MASKKNKKVEETVEGAEGTEAVKGGKRVMLLVDGEEIARTDYIRKLWAEGELTRGAIAKKLSELQGKTVPYQIVFAATKGLAGGPAKTEGSEEAAA